MGALAGKGSEGQRGALLWSVAVIWAIALGAYMTLGDLRSGVGDTSETSAAFVPLCVIGIVALVGLLGWHAVWLMPVAAWGFAVIYEKWFWDGPDIGGMDGIAYDPSSVVILLFFAVPGAALVACLRSVLLGRMRLDRSNEVV